MSATLNPGFKQLYLYLTKPTNAIDIDDDSTIGNQQAIDNSVREDLIGLKVWASTQQNFDASQTQPVYDGVFNTTTAIQNLADNTTYYVRYAFISAIDETVYTILPAGNPLSEKTLDTNSGITAYLTHDPIEIVTDEFGNNPVFTNNTGTFKVYTNTEDVTGNPTVVTYSVVANSATGGVTATIDSNGTYTVTAITDLTGTITFKATGVQFPGVYVDKILNVAKRRPGQTAPLVTITGTGSYFVEMANGNGKYPGSYTWSATTTNITSPQYTWYFGRTSQGALIPVEGTGAEYTGGVLTGLSLNGSKNEVTIQNSVFNNLTPPQEKLLKVVVTSGVQGTNVNVFDQESIFYLQEGSDALVIDLVNENQTISLDKDGNIISPVNILSQILVARGTDLVTTNITYAIAAVEYITSNQIQLTSAGAITIPSSAVTADSASATFSATVTHPDSTVTTLTKKLTLNRVRDGQTGATGTNISVQLTNDYHAIPTTSTGVVGTYLGANTTLESYINGILQTTGFTYYVSALQNVKYRDNDDTSDRTATGVINGLISSFPLQIVELTADSGTIDITAKQNSDNQVFTKTFTVTKNKQGVQGNDSVIYELRASTSAIGKYSIDQTTDGTHTPSTVNFTVYKTIGNQLPQILNDQSLYYIKWTSAQEPANNDSNALQLPSSGVITHAIGNTDGILHVSVKLLVKNSANNYTQIDREEIPVLFRGATGTNISVQLTNDYHAIPTTSTGVVGTYLGANTTLESYINGILQTTGFTYYVSALQNVKYRDNDDTSDRTATGVINGLISSFPLQIVELTADSGTIDITAKQNSDNQVFTKTFTVSKNKQGVQGNDSVIYELRASTSAIGKYSIDQTTDGTHTPSTVNFTVYKTIGNQLPQILNDQSLYYIKWTSAQEPANNDSNALQLPSSGVITHAIGNTDDIVHVSVKLLVKNSANNYTQIDREEIPVLFRGAPGLDSVAINLSNDSHPLPIDDSGSVLSYSGATTTGSINLGGVDKTGEWTWTIDLLSSNLGTGGSSGITANIVGSTVTVSGVTSNFLSGIVRLKASKIGYLDSYKDFSISKIKADIYYIELTNDDHYFSADLNGNVTDFTGATTTATVKRGGIDDTANWSFSTPVVTSGITISVSNNNRTVTVIGLTSSFRTGSVTFTATSGVKTLTETFSLVSILQGPKGDQSTVPGSDGKIGLISKIAYLKLTQQDKLLTITTATTTGANSVPTGTYTNANNTSTTATFSQTVPTSIEVGDVVWYAYGRYNPNATALDGVAADKIVWDQPIAASVFQDIKSDNWTGGTPSLGNFGSNPTGYYLNKSEGSLYATSVYLRKETSVDAIKALGSAVTINTKPQVINTKTYNTIKSTIGAIYSGQAETSYNDGIIRATIFAGTNYDASVAWNVGLVVQSKGIPTGSTSEGTNQGLDNNIGIISSATKFGGYFETTTVTGTGLIAKYTNAETPVKANGGYALWVEGNMRWGPSVWTIPPNDNTKFLRSDGEWATAGTPSGGNSANFLRGDGQWTNVLLGDLYVSGEITAYYSSDISLKTNIRKITNPLEKLLSLGGYNFDWAQDYLKKRDSKSGLIKTSDVGIIAQEVQKVMPEVVVTREDGMLAVNYHKLIPLIIEAIAELNNKIDGKQGK